MINKPRWVTITDSRGIKRQVYQQGDPDWRQKEDKELREHQLRNYTRKQFLEEGFQ